MTPRYKVLVDALTGAIFETGAYGVPSNSQKPTVLGQGCPSSTQCSIPRWAWCWYHPFGTNNYPPFQHTKDQLISKANCRAVDSPKKNEQMNLLFLT